MLKQQHLQVFPGTEVKVLTWLLPSVSPYRADMITGSQAKGLGNFVSKFALPALLFKNMVLLDFGDVIWAFLWSVLVAKVCGLVVTPLQCVYTFLFG